MNVIIANKYADALSSLNIDVIKRMDGEFDVETIIDTFANFYFNKIIIDITAIKQYFNIVSFQKLCAHIDSSKIILFLCDDPRINNSFLSKIISVGIYNFTREIAGITYLMENPNSYRDVAQYHNLAANDAANINNAAQMGNHVGINNNMNVNSNVNNNAQMNNYPQNNMGQVNTAAGMMAAGGVVANNFNQQQQFMQSQTVYPQNNTYIIGFKDLSDDAGSTTLIYMLKKQLKNYKVLAVEINANEFSYFNDSELMSTSSNQLVNVKNSFKQFDIVLVDINNSPLETDGTCNEIIYLLEPSTIKLNSIVRKDRQFLEKIKDKKIVLNKSLLSMSDVKQFEYEAKTSIFYNIPPLDERQDSQMVLSSFLAKLGINDGSNSGRQQSGGIFNIFKK